MTHAANNPFFGKFKTPFETPPFDKIKIEHYEPAFDEGIKQMEPATGYFREYGSSSGT